jgi:hypothetical protein
MANYNIHRTSALSKAGFQVVSKDSTTGTAYTDSATIATTGHSHRQIWLKPLIGFVPQAAQQTPQQVTARLSVSILSQHHTIIDKR